MGFFLRPSGGDAAIAALLRCPSLLSARRSALLPVTLAPRLRSGSDTRFQLAAACQGCGGGPNGDSRIRPSARLFLRSQEREVSRDAAAAEPTVERNRASPRPLSRPDRALSTPGESEIDSLSARRRDP